MMLPALTRLPRRLPLFYPAVLLLILVAVSAAIWAGTGPAGAQDGGGLQVSVTADPVNPEVNKPTRLTATIADPPSGGRRNTTGRGRWKVGSGTPREQFQPVVADGPGGDVGLPGDGILRQRGDGDVGGGNGHLE